MNARPCDMNAWAVQEPKIMKDAFDAKIQYIC